MIKLDSAIYFNVEFREPWCLTSPESRTLAPVLAPGIGHVIIYHFLCEGRAYAQLPGGKPVVLSAGDVVMFPHGHPHVLGSGTSVPAMDAGDALQGVLDRGLELLHFGGTGASSRLICGFLACDPQLGQAFLAGLPPLIKVNIRDDSSGRWLENSLQFSVAQAASREAGSNAVLAKLSADMDAVLHQADVRARLIDYGIDPVGGKPEQFQAFIKAEAVRWGEVVKKSGVKLE